MKFLRALLAICKKDLLCEFRKKERIGTLIFFGVIVIFIFSFAFGADPKLLKSLSPGLIWIVSFFSSLLALERSFQSEAEEGCLDRLILYSASHAAVLLGKLITNFIFIFFVQCVIFFLMKILFDLENPASFSTLAAAFFLGNLGIATLGTFYAALVTSLKARQAMLPLLLFPMLIPLLLACVVVTEEAWGGSVVTNAAPWLKMMMVFDGIFLAACLLAISPIFESNP